jgi:uncharacterized protein involved in cysteine biosynthesis
MSTAPPSPQKSPTGRRRTSEDAPVVPCSLCGYDAPGTACPHCRLSPGPADLREPPPGAFGEVLAGLAAVPKGLMILASTRGTKRWTLPPLALTVLMFVVVFAWLRGWLGSYVDGALPDGVPLDAENWEWVQGLDWEWVQAAVVAVIAAVKWVADLAVGLAAGQFTSMLLWFALAMLAGWYMFSMAYEAVAGPFLDEIQGRVEAKWFGADPRTRMERPTDLPVERCAKLTAVGSTIGVLVLLLGVFTSLVPLWLGLLLAPVPLVLLGARDREYGKWLRWVGAIEGRALWVGVQASVITGVVLVVALPLYFVFPPVGYILFAGVVGFATSVSLLDIPFERRRWRVKQRLGFVGRHLPAMIAFGAVSGFLLTIPLVGWALMVPGASVGGMWLLCRLEKGAMREGAPALPRSQPPPGAQ